MNDICILKEYDEEPIAVTGNKTTVREFENIQNLASLSIGAIDFGSYCLKDLRDIEQTIKKYRELYEKRQNEKVGS